MKKAFSVLILFLLLPLFPYNVAFAATNMQGSKAKVVKQGVLGAKAYNIYYRESGEKKFTHSVRLLPQNFNDYTITSLKKGVSYSYVLSALNENGKEFWFSSLKKLSAK